MDAKEMQGLVSEVNRHNHLYYVEAAPVITDQAYDKLYRSLLDAEKKYPKLVQSDSPTQRVGSKLEGDWKTIEHTKKMLSLDNTYDEKELRTFDARVRKELNGAKFLYSAELKIDGAAISLWYRDGLLVRGLTRGDGEKGEDVTHTVRTIQCIPLRLNDEDPPKFVEVRGEVYMPRGVFAKLNEQHEEAGTKPLANPRNAAAGAIKRKTPKQTAASQLAFFAHTFGYIEGSRFATHREFLAAAKRWGIPPVRSKLCKDINEVWTLVGKVDGRRKLLEYDTDGIVVKVDSLDLQERLGQGSKAPRYAIAYKYPAEQAETVLEDIDVQVGKTGALTPVGRLRPVQLAGSTISNVTLCNQDLIDEKDIRIGDHVMIQKAGEIIPQVVTVVKEKRTGKERKYKIPSECPECGAKAVRNDGEVAVRCQNPMCKAKLQKLVEYFVSRRCMDIDGVGDKLITKLIESGLVKDPSDLYRLTEDQFRSLDGVKGSAAKYVEKIAGSKGCDLSRLIASLNIPMIGRTLGEVLSSELGSLESLRRATFDELEPIDKVGTEKAKSIVGWFKDPSNSDYIDRLISAGVNTKSKAKKIENPLFQSKSFVLTGTLANYSRDGASALIKQRGGKTSGSVSKKTDFLLAGDKAGSKLKKAQDLGVKVLNESEFEKMLAKT